MAVNYTVEEYDMMADGMQLLIGQYRKLIPLDSGGHWKVDTDEYERFRHAQHLEMSFRTAAYNLAVQKANEGKPVTGIRKFVPVDPNEEWAWVCSVHGRSGCHCPIEDDIDAKYITEANRPADQSGANPWYMR